MAACSCYKRFPVSVNKKEKISGQMEIFSFYISYIDYSAATFGLCLDVME